MQMYTRALTRTQKKSINKHIIEYSSILRYRVFHFSIRFLNKFETVFFIKFSTKFHIDIEHEKL